MPDQSLVSFWEFPAFAPLGVVCALTAIIFLRSVSVATTSPRIPIVPYLKTMAGGFCVGVIALAFPEVMGVGYEATDKALNGGMNLPYDCAAGGVRRDENRVGAGFEAAYSRRQCSGAWSVERSGDRHPDLPELSSGHSAYTLVGLGGSRAVLEHYLTILIVFELTADYDHNCRDGCCVIASVITQQVRGNSFTWQPERRGINVRGGRETGLMAMTKVENVMSLKYTPVMQELNINGVREKLLTALHGELFVVDENGALTGTITLKILPTGHSIIPSTMW